MSEETPLQAAQNRLAKAALAQPMNPNQAAISAYINSILQTCRLDALTELWLTPPNSSWTPQEALDAAILRAVTQKAEAMEKIASAVQIAGASPKLHLVS